MAWVELRWGQLGGFPDTPPDVGAQQQTVVATLMGDRHADLHERDYAQSSTVVVTAGPLAHVLIEAAVAFKELPVGRYSITISEPFDPPRQETR